MGKHNCICAVSNNNYYTCLYNYKGGSYCIKNTSLSTSHCISVCVYIQCILILCWRYSCISRAYILKGEGGHNYVSAVSGIHVYSNITTHFSHPHIQFRCVYIHTVYSNPEKTVLAILLLRMFISSEGLVRPVHHGGYTPRSLSQQESVSEGVIIIGCEVIYNYVCMYMGWSCFLVISSHWSQREVSK